MSENTDPTTEPVISARSLDLVGATDVVEPRHRGRYRAARNKIIDRGMATAEYAVGMLAAVALALVLLKVVTHQEVFTKLLKLVVSIIGKAKACCRDRSGSSWRTLAGVRHAGSLPAAIPAAYSTGMVTVEMAVSLIAATLVVATSCWVVGLVVVEDACRTTAAQVARQVARGDTASARQAESNAPTGAKVSTTTSGGWVNVTVQVDRSLGRIGPVHLRGQARSPMEPGQT